MVSKGDHAEYGCVVRAWRLSHWANHAWGLLEPEQVAEVWDVAPSLQAFCQTLPGYAVSKGWIAKGPAGYGVLGPRYENGELVMWVGRNAQVEARFGRDRGVVRYGHERRTAQCAIRWIGVDAWSAVLGSGQDARPRDWARVARLLIIAENPPNAAATDIREACRLMVGPEPDAQREFWDYYWRTGPELLVAP